MAQFQMSAVFDKVCPYCGRLQLLWGGETCDVCDSDSNGINDRNEPTGSGAVVTPSVFESRQVGWEMVGSMTRRKGLPDTFPLLPTRKQSDRVLRVLKILKRRFELES